MLELPLPQLVSLPAPLLEALRLPHPVVSLLAVISSSTELPGNPSVFPFSFRFSRHSYCIIVVNTPKTVDATFFPNSAHNGLTLAAWININSNLAVSNNVYDIIAPPPADSALYFSLSVSYQSSNYIGSGLHRLTNIIPVFSIVGNTVYNPIQACATATPSPTCPNITINTWHHLAGV